MLLSRFLFALQREGIRPELLPLGEKASFLSRLKRANTLFLSLSLMSPRTFNKYPVYGEVKLVLNAASAGAPVMKVEIAEVWFSFSKLPKKNARSFFIGPPNEPPDWYRRKAGSKTPAGRKNVGSAAKDLSRKKMNPFP